MEWACWWVICQGEDNLRWCLVSFIHLMINVLDIWMVVILSAAVSLACAMHTVESDFLSQEKHWISTFSHTVSSCSITMLQWLVWYIALTSSFDNTPCKHMSHLWSFLNYPNPKSFPFFILKPWSSKTFFQQNLLEIAISSAKSKKIENGILFAYPIVGSCS